MGKHEDSLSMEKPEKDLTWHSNFAVPWQFINFLKLQAFSRHGHVIEMLQLILYNSKCMARFSLTL